MIGLFVAGIVAICCMYVLLMSLVYRGRRWVPNDEHAHRSVWLPRSSVKDADVRAAPPAQRVDPLDSEPRVHV